MLTLFQSDIHSALDGLNREKFRSDWRACSSIQPCSVSKVDDFIKAHYLKKRPAIVTLCLEMTVRDFPVGMVVFALPPKEANKRYGGETWELARLYIIDDVPKNAETWLIAQSVRYIKRNRPDIKYLLSYADPSAGHAGTIYKAANWTSDGRTDQERKSPRNDYVDARTGKKYSRKGHLPNGAVISRRPRISKWRFVYSLTG